MPRRPGRSTSAPDPTKAALMRLDPALALLAAVVQQALSDVRTPTRTFARTRLPSWAMRRP